MYSYNYLSAQIYMANQLDNFNLFVEAGKMTNSMFSHPRSHDKQIENHSELRLFLYILSKKFLWRSFFSVLNISIQAIHVTTLMMGRLL